MLLLVLLWTDAAAGLVKADPDEPAPRKLRTLLKPAPADGFQAKPAGALGRRAAAVGLFGMPLAAPAYSYGKGEFSGYKARNYGDMDAPGSAPPKPDKPRMMPDGKGGYVERDAPVKSVSARVVDSVADALDRPAPSAPAAPAPAQRAVASTQSSSAPKSFEDLLANSIQQKEQLLGRPLEGAERAQLESKLKALLQ